MAYIEVHQNLRDHPKLHDLCGRMQWEDPDLGVGKLVRFWLWCVDYAETGELKKFNDATLAKAAGLSGMHAKTFVDSMVASCWIDRDGDAGIFRVHDWWDYIGPWLRAKYKRSPHKWKAVRAIYKAPEEAAAEDEWDGQPGRNRYVTPYQTNQPNQPTNAAEKSKRRVLEKFGAKNDHAGNG